MRPHRGFEPRTPLDERTRRYEQMQQLEAQGVSRSQIADMFNLSPSRVSQILKGGPPRKPGRPW